MTRNIPNTITCCNLISGCIATLSAFMGEIHMALLWIIIGAIFDFFDGMSARLLHVSSPIGKELDSLADDITFGMAPAAIVFYEMGIMEYPAFLAPVQPYMPFVAFLIAAFSALRLAKFNLDERQAMGFIGLPTPANALFWGALLVGAGDFIENTTWMVPVVIVMILLSCWLLVSEIPMFALKFKHWGWKGNEVKYLFLITCVPLLIVFGVTAFAIIIAWYVLLSALVNKRNRKQPC
ncbi:MAG: CDP-diacylglycerol--serine O-phosphatidyltransferase [Prevotella sp.]|nr:CDP-diacylglycerol--serine O-phosphatidyltransferase [Prevotella sp.]MCI6461817.1 CDP-diacylglycerol--serine O-phosphatidyltransferase [Prevotella sp.]MDD6670272.1 CDP-diacylglycerol--serine O-phosphatidyltransferase [Prevotella sp.]MDY3272646.1 CDP-diacylglycerol--serine O-phosphatidyltransferase [Prevotella sp.]MDY3896954.1 CDP-diacylglycerol--serine O-phosphatidyltransferase [Prevotella sp.]